MLPKFHLFVAMNVGGSVGWWAGDSLGIFGSLVGSGVGACLGIWLVWRFREYLGG